MGSYGNYINRVVQMLYKNIEELKKEIKKFTDVASMEVS